MLKKVLCFLMTILIVSTFCACSDEPNEEKAGKDMEVVLSELFRTVQAQDQESFKTFFDGDILAQPDFEDGMNYVFSSYTGNVQNITCKFPMSIETWFEPGERIYLACTNFNIITNENEYIVYVEFFTQYESKYPNSPYKIRRFKLLQKQEWDNGENFTDCTQRLGIYYPGWLN